MAAIEGIGGPNPLRLGARGRARTATGFAVPTETAIAGKPATDAAQPVGLASMLALQELGGETGQDREARSHGQMMLEALAELQRTLLTGADDLAALRRLAELAEAMPRATDPRLAAMISAIIVRVRVELARRHL